MDDETDHEIRKHHEKTVALDTDGSVLHETGLVDVERTLECTCGETFEDEDAAIDHIDVHPVEQALRGTKYDVVDDRFDGGGMSTYFDVDPDFAGGAGSGMKLGRKFYDAVRDAGYRVTATYPNFRETGLTRVWIDEV